MIAPERVTAVVLTGGRSTRMGRDKATLVPDDGDPRTLARRVLDSLQPVAAHALLAGVPVPDAPPGVAAVIDQYPQAGPLGGVATALPYVRTDLAVVAACDMPSIAAPLVADMLDRADAAGAGTLCVVCTGEHGVEPLLSVWRPAAAPLLDAALRAGVRALREALDGLPHLAIPPQQWRAHDPQGASFRNWNRPQDLP